MFVTRQQPHPTALRPKSMLQDELWNSEENCAAGQRGSLAPQGTAFDDSPRHGVRAATALDFLRQIWHELLEWTLTAVKAAQTMATAAMNIILLSVVAAFALLAVVTLFIRDQIMDRPATGANTSRMAPLAEASEPSEMPRKYR